MSKKPLLLIFTLFISLCSVQAQKYSCEDLNPNSGNSITKGLEAYENQNYKDAVFYLGKVFPGDTNYYWAQYELGLAYNGMKKYEETVKIAENLIALNKGNWIQNTVMLGNALDNLDRVDDAIKAYDGAIATNPNEYLLYYNKGVALFMGKRYEEAEKVFIRSAELNPIHQGSHYFLGAINLMAGRYVQGLMAIEYSMLLNSKSNMYKTSLSVLDKACVLQFPEKDDHIKLSEDVEDAGDFVAANEIFNSLLALNDKYKPKKLPNFRLVKQSALFFENLESCPGNDKSFYSRFYLKLYRSVKAAKLERAYLAHVLANTQNEVLDKFYVSEKKNYDKIIQTLGAFINETATKTTIVYNGKEYYCKVEFNGSGGFKHAFELDPNTDEVKKDGIVLVFFSTGGVYKEARLKNGELTGECKLFNQNGTLFETNYLVNGTEQGEAKEYYESGELLVTKTYKDGDPEGIVKIFYPDGNLKLTYTLVKGLKNGLEKKYYNDGKIKSEFSFLNGDYNGHMKEYFHNGQIQYEYDYRGDAFDGPYVEHYVNGQLKSEFVYKNNQLIGTYKTYHPNGKLKEEGTFDDKSKRTGTWKSYYYNGQLENETSYLSGQKQGKGIDYDRDGIKHLEYEYANGNYTTIRFFDKKGNMTNEFKEDKNIIKYTFYYPEGMPKFDGALKNGKADGVWTYYYPTTGDVSKKVNYLNGDANGEWIEFYADQAPKFKGSYKDDNQDGHVMRNFEDGITMSSQYCATDGKTTGRIINYFPNGSVRNESYYLYDDYNGPFVFYDLMGRVYNIEHYENGNFVGEEIFDTTGKKVFEIKTGAGLTPYIDKYPNGQIRVRGSYLNGKLHDSLIFYFPDGKIESTAYFESGQREGKYTEYDHQGNLVEEGYYENDNLQGTQKTYFTNGNIHEIHEYMDGLEYGKAQFFYYNGKPEYVVEREGDNNYGWGVWYDENGHEAHKNFFVDDYPVYFTYKDKNNQWVPNISIKDSKGVVTSYLSNGKKFLERTYKGSDMDGDAIVHFSDGSIYSISKQQIGSYNGAVKEYYPNHKLRKDENYWFNRYHGVQTYYNENGSLSRQLTYEFGNLNGPCKYYDKNGKLLYTVMYYQNTAVEIK